MESTGLKKKDLKKFREILLAKKAEILKNAKRTLAEDMTLDSDDLPDEMDLASSEYLQSFTFRLRGREKTFLKKIGVPCPLDDGAVVERRTKGRRVFYGCSNYPRCDFVSWTRPTGERCPVCGGAVVMDGANGVKCLKCSWRAEREPAEVSA